MFLKLLLISLAMVLLAVLALSVNLILKKNGKFSGGSCKSSPGLESKGMSCGCGNSCQTQKNK